MELTDFLSPHHVCADLKASSKKNLLQGLASKMARSFNLDESDVFTALTDRERLGSTGVGHGVAVPHARLEGIDQIHGYFARLSEPVDFDSIDEQPADLVFMLLAPEDAGADHLKALSRVSRMLRDEKFCMKLRDADSVDAITALLIGPDKESAAA